MVGPFEVAIAGIAAGTLIAMTKIFAASAKPRDVARLPNDLDERLRRMEQSIDAIAVEVERVSEGQRFTTRLLSERTAGPALAANPDAAARGEATRAH